jgi:hypothetical protein
VLIAVTTFLAATGRLKLSPDWAVLAAYPVLSLTIAILSRIQIGERHILPAYVFALLFAGGAWEFARSSGGRIPRAIVLVGLALNMADISRYAPDYLSYFNVFVRPQNSWRLVSDSNLDWGQGLIALRKYEAAHPNEAIHLAYFGSVRPNLYDARALPLAPDERVHGTVVVSATQLSGQNLEDPQGYRWVLSYPLRTMLNHSMFVFEVP